MFEIIGIPAFKDNYIWLLRKGAEAVLVDPGEAAPVLAVLRQAGLRLAAILITHKHADHQGGIAELLASAPESVAVYGPAAESITGLTHPLAGGEHIRLVAIDAEFQVFPVPGHTLGHLAYYGHACLFSGDTLFAGGCGRLFEGTPAQMFESLSRLAALPDATQIYCAHEYTEANLRFAQAVEPSNEAVRARCAEVAAQRAQGGASVPSSLGVERLTNPFLRSSAPEVVMAAQRHDPAASDPLSVFAAVRAWKNVF